MALPLGEIVALANVLADVSGKLYRTYKDRKRPPMPDAQAAPEDQLQALREHVQQLEAVQEKQADLALQVVEQVQSVSVALAGHARRSRLALWLSAAAFACGFASLVMAWPA